MNTNNKSISVKQIEQSEADALLNNEEEAARAQEADRHKLELTLNSCSYLDTQLENARARAWNKANYARARDAADLAARVAAIRKFLTEPEASP
jgi:hypothetical protein